MAPNRSWSVFNDSVRSVVEKSNTEQQQFISSILCAHQSPGIHLAQTMHFGAGFLAPVLKSQQILGSYSPTSVEDQ